MEYGIELLVPITVALVEAIKRVGVVPANYLPLVSVAVGAALGYLSGVSGLEILVVGLGASGLYELGKNPVRAAVAKVRG